MPIVVCVLNAAVVGPEEAAAPSHYSRSYHAKVRDHADANGLVHEAEREAGATASEFDDPFVMDENSVLAEVRRAMRGVGREEKHRD